MDKDIIKPIVSIIMPAYNASRYIQEAINSVIAQSYSNWELIIIDDGSTDNTAQIVKYNCRVDNRIKYFFQKNGKQGKARNLGLSKCLGNYIAFLDADDLWLPEKLEIQIDEIKDKNVDLVFSNSYYFNDNNIADKSNNMNVLSQIYQGTEALKIFLEYNRIPILTVLTKKDKLLAVDGFSERLEIQNAEDYHLWLKMLLHGFVFYSSEKILTSYRIHSHSCTSLDKSATKQLPEVFYDLLKSNPNGKKLIIKALKKKLRNVYARNMDNKYELNAIIHKNCHYLNMAHFAYLFTTINFFFGVKMTKKILNHSLNF